MLRVISCDLYTSMLCLLKRAGSTVTSREYSNENIVIADAMVSDGGGGTCEYGGAIFL